jgi:hypothetical protein
MSPRADAARIQSAGNKPDRRDHCSVDGKGS